MSRRWMRRAAAAASSLALGIATGAGATVVAPGFAVTAIPLSDVAAGDVVAVGDALFVGVGPGFTAQAESVVRIDPSGTTVLAEGFNALAGFAYDAVNDRLIVGDNALEATGAVTGDTIYAIPAPLGAFPTPLAAAGLELLDAGSLPGVSDLVLDPADASGQTLFATDSVTNEVLRVDLAGGAVSSLQSTAGFASGLAVDASTLFFGEVSFDANFVATGSLSAVALPGDGAPALLTGELPGQYDLEVASDGALLSTSGSELLRIDPISGEATSLAGGFGFAAGLFERDGTVWVLDGGFPGVAAVYELEPVPEPAAAALVAAAALTLLGVARRRRRIEPRRAASRLLLLALASAVAAPAVRASPHGPPAIRVVAPTPGSAVTWMPLRIELELAARADPRTLRVQLNGTDITAAFAFSPRAAGRVTAAADFVWGGIVLPGPNWIDVDVRLGRSGRLASRSARFDAVGDPYADDLVSYALGAYGGFPGTDRLPGIVLGPPRGGGLLEGGFDVFSLGFGGSAVLAFTDNVIVDGPGVDFTVFENAFLVENSATLTLERPFADPGVVSVSQDGIDWRTFPCDPRFDAEQEVVYPGCAGVTPVLSNADEPSTPHASIPTDGGVLDWIGAPSFPLPEPAGAGGDSFDLDRVGLAWARYVRIEDADVDTGNPFGPTTAGFDLDAIAAVHSAPSTDADGDGIPDAVEPSRGCGLGLPSARPAARSARESRACRTRRGAGSSP